MSWTTGTTSTVMAVICAVAMSAATERAALADAGPQVRVQGAGGFKPLVAGERAFGPSPRYTWLPIPASLKGHQFWQMQAGPGWPSPAYGKVTFNVVSSGVVLMATTTRYGAGGNSSGNWKGEVTTPAQLRAAGWKIFKSGLANESNHDGKPYHSYDVWSRECKAGDTFTYRTEKYVPPMILSSGGRVMPASAGEPGPRAAPRR